MHLSDDHAKLFYSTWMPLITWVNRELSVLPLFDVPTDQTPIDREKVLVVRDAMWKRQDLLDRYVLENPMGASEVELSLVRGFEHRVAGKFVVFRHLAKSTIFLSTAGPARGFHVVGITHPILDDQPVPLLVEGVLIPFGDVITYDSLLSSYPVHIGPGMRRLFDEEYKEAKAAGTIVRSLGPEPRPLVAPAPLTKKTQRPKAASARPTSNVVPFRRREAAGDIEWIAGIVEIEGVRLRELGSAPLAIMAWLTSTGEVARAESGLAHELLAMAAPELRAALASTKAPRPTRVRVASTPFAEALRAADPSLEVVVAPTPELDELRDQVSSELGALAATPSHLGGDASPDDIGAAFVAAKELYGTRPWEKLPHGDFVFIAEIPALGVSGSVVAVVGQNREIRGLMVHESLASLSAFLDAGEGIAGGDGSPDIPPFLAITFEGPNEAEPALVAEAKAHGWVTPGRNVHTTILFHESVEEVRGPTPSEVALAEALCRAIALAMREPKVVADAWDGVPYERVFQVATKRGAASVTLTTALVPEGPQRDPRPYIELLLDRETPDLDVDVAEDVLVQCFEREPEIEMLDEDRRFLDLLLDLARQQLGCSLVAATRDDLRRLVFETVPEKVAIAPSDADALLVELRAFYIYLERCHGAFAAHAVVVGPSQAPALRLALADTRRYAPEKAAAMAALAAGVDPSLAEMDRFMATYRTRASSPDAPTTKKKAAASAAKRNARKAANKARRRNR